MHVQVKVAEMKSNKHGNTICCASASICSCFDMVACSSLWNRGPESQPLLIGSAEDGTSVAK